MRTSVIELNNRKWALGFDWSVPGEKKSFRQIVSEGSLLSADIIATRGGQQGFGASDTEDPGPYYESRSAAAWLEPEEKSFIVCLHLKDYRGLDTWWVFARLDGFNIAGLGDRIYQNEYAAAEGIEDIKKLLPTEARFELETTITGLEEAEQWLSERLRTPNFLDVVMARGAARKLAGYHGLSFFYIEVFLLLLVVGFGVWKGAVTLKDYLTEQGVTQAAKVVEKQHQLRREFIRKHPEKVWDTGWVDVEPAETAGGTCLDIVGATPIALGGWKYRGSECHYKNDTTTARAKYAQTPLSTYFGLPRGTSFNPKKPKEMQESRKSRNNPVQGKDLDWTHFFGQPYLETWFLQFSQIYKVQAVVRFRTREKITEKNVGTFECPWARGDWTIRNVPTRALLETMKPLEKLPGMAVRSMKYNMHTWEIQGEVYGK